ncbi:MAG: hypothetical protein ACKVWV_08400, partial [Planctomycetota bacterium]
MATFRFHGPRLVAFATLATAGSFARAPAMQFDTTERISVDSAGNQNTSHARGTRISADGSRVAYWARQGSLVPDDGNNADDVFVSDRRTGVTRRVSISSSGVAGNGASAPTSLSADGRYIVFDSSASNLVPGDTNAQTDVFLHDVNTGTTTRVSTTSSGVEGNGFSVLGSISADGRFVAFETNSTNFLGDGLPGGTVVVDRQTGAMTRASVSTGGAWGYGARPAISGDGRFVAFDSGSTSLVDGDTNAQIDVFVHDRQTGITRRVSVSSTGEQLLTSCFTPSISFDGQRVAFHTNSSFVPNQPYGVVMHDMETGATTQVSVTTGGTAVLGALPVISSDGTFIAFESSNANIDPADSGSVIDIFLYEVATGAVRRVDASSFGVPAWSHCHEAALSGDGRAVAFWSGATNLVTADTNGADDVFVHETVDASIASFCFGDGQRAP